MALSSRLGSGAKQGKDHTQQGKVPAVRAYFIPVRRIMFHLGYIISPLHQPNALKPDLSRETSQCRSIPKSFLAAAGTFVTHDGYFKQFHGCVFYQGAARTKFLPGSPSSTPEPRSHPQGEGFLSPTECGGPAATPGACPSSLPYPL